MKTRKYPSFDAFYRDQPKDKQAILRALRAFMKKAAPKLQESVKWGNGVWLDEGTPVCYAYVGPDHVQYGFFAGARLKDPLKLLQGQGRHVRHIKLFKPKDLDPKAFRDLLKQAA
jgi:hypothetical protein